LRKMDAETGANTPGGRANRSVAVSTFQAAGDAKALARGMVPDRAHERIKLQEALQRLDGETSNEYWAFREYIFSGPKRSFKLPAELLGVSAAWVSVRSKQFRWEERALLYDQAGANLAALAHADETERMAARHARTGRVMQAIGAKLVRSIDTGPNNNHKLSEITQLLKAGTELEHRAVVGVADRKEEVVVILASFQEVANLKTMKALRASDQEDDTAGTAADPQDAGVERDDTTIEMAELSSGAFAPVEPEGDEGADFRSTKTLP
jgi:hypothetical protein